MSIFITRHKYGVLIKACSKMFLTLWQHAILIVIN